MLMGFVWLYWALVPVRFRRLCLFRESCSRHVFRVSRDHGGARGLEALRSRFRDCRPGWAFDATLDGRITLRLSQGRLVDPDEIDPRVLAPARSSLRQLECKLAHGNGETP